MPPAPKSPPTSVQFLIADDIRIEEGTKKAFVLGLFPGDDVLVEDDTPGKVISSLCIIAVIKDGVGTFDAHIRLFAPNNKELIEPASAPVDKLPENALTLLFKWVPFHVPEFGTYVLRITLDQNPPYEYRFRIRPRTKVGP